MSRDGDPHPFRVGPGEVTGALADLGIFVPLATALVLVNGFDGGLILIVAGALVVVSGALFRLPWPVQPLKALTALAVAQQLDSDVVRAAGLELGLLLLVLSIPAVMQPLSRAFTMTVVRALQVGVGVLLTLSAVRLVTDTPAPFGAELPLLTPHLGGLELGGFPGLGSMAAAFFLLVVPQIPLTLGNAVVAVSQTARDYFGPRAQRVTPSKVAVVASLANITSAAIGGMPMCHGAGGLTAHYRLGARTAGMNLVLGTTFITIGVLFGPQMPELLGAIPAWLLAGFLAYAGVRHALLALDRRGRSLVITLGAGLIGAVTGNLALTTVIAMVLDHAPKLINRKSAPAKA